MSVPFITRRQMACLAPKTNKKNKTKKNFRCEQVTEAGRQLHDQGEAHDERCNREKPGDAGRMRARQTWKDRQERGAKGRGEEGSARRHLFYRRVCVIPATTATTQIKHVSCMFFPSSHMNKRRPICRTHASLSKFEHANRECVRCKQPRLNRLVYIHTAAANNTEIINSNSYWKLIYKDIL